MTVKTPSLDRLIDSYLVCCVTEEKSPKTIEFSDFLRVTKWLIVQSFTNMSRAWMDEYWFEGCFEWNPGRTFPVRFVRL